MGYIIPIALLALLLLFFFRPFRRRAVPEPEDDVTTPIDRAELEQAEREVKDARGAKSIDEAEQDDWGPGAG